MMRANVLAADGQILPDLLRAIRGMSGNSIRLSRWLTYAGRAGQPDGKGWIRLSPRGFKKARK
jgi:hypothetical protein